MNPIVMPPILLPLPSRLPLMGPPPALVPGTFSAPRADKLGGAGEDAFLPLQSNIDLSDLGNIEALLKSHQFGLDLPALLRAGSGFHTEYRGSQVVLTIPPATPQVDGIPTRGSAAELAYFTGVRLQQTLGAKYDIRLAQGFCGRYFLSSVNNPHPFLLLSARANPVEQVIVDPSLKVVGRLELLPDYTIQLLKPLSPDGLGRFSAYIPPKGASAGLPLGTVEDVVPEASEVVNPKGLVYLAFQMRNGCPQPVLALQAFPHSPIGLHAKLMSFIRPADPITTFLQRIETDLSAGFPAILGPYWQMNQGLSKSGLL